VDNLELCFIIDSVYTAEWLCAQHSQTIQVTEKRHYFEHWAELLSHYLKMDLIIS